MEYVLLLVIVVGLAVLITNAVVSRDPNQPGFLMIKWNQIIQTVGSDRAAVLGGHRWWWRSVGPVS